MIRRRRAIAALLLAAAATLAGCQRAPQLQPERGADAPARALELLLQDLRDNDLAGYARHAVPPALHGSLERAWREGRTLWPLTELPLHERLPGMLAALAAPDSERRLLATYRRQFAGADAELRSAAAALGLFAAQYLRTQDHGYSEDERAHYLQLVEAMRGWGQRAPLGDLRRAQRHVPRLAAAARLTGLGTGEARMRELGMAASLERLGPFAARFKQVLADYGLDLDATLDGAAVTLERQDGDRARLRLRYVLAGRAIEARLQAERRDGRWYLSDVLRHAEAEAARR
ncbi:hypothetical protein [Vulcaniibacterium tengchongense]|uniref:Lipoprotein n=1 Tax=Vulcaniibacterium tengchongense TaxID=1273429 RepID=A0A3N4VB36_9GAMM|nr:hypothetical protein [Vulcaniibacterium tengchongense]RPE80216.1 hypothetical protein EDC50_2048 [Vulcaniibacterium tengchongense]